MKKINSDLPDTNALQASQTRVLKAFKAHAPTIVSTLPATTERAFGPVDSTLQPMFTLRWRMFHCICFAPNTPVMKWPNWAAMLNAA